MSKFLNSPEAVLSPDCLLINTLTYILEELIDVAVDPTKLDIPIGYVKDDGVEFIGKLLNDSNHQLRMYGSARELADNVKIYMNTAGSLRYFDVKEYFLHPYHTAPIVYKSVKNEEYICKADTYVILQNMTLEAYPFEKSQVLRVLIAIFLKSQELENLKKMEFVKFDQVVFDAINKQIQDVMKRFGTDRSAFYSVMEELLTCDFPKLVQKFQNLIPIEWKDLDSPFFEKVLASHVRDFSNEPNFSNSLTVLYHTIGEIVKNLKRIIDERSDIFKSPQKFPITVRLFEDGDREEPFVMKAELIDALNRTKKANQKTLSYTEYNLNTVDTMTMREALEKFTKKRMQGIEFIRVPIRRAQHRAVPMPMPMNHTDYCILAVDAFFELMRSLMFGVKVFQKAGLAGWDMFTVLFKSLEQPFRPEEKNAFFLTLNLNSMVTGHMDELEMLPAVEIRNAKKDGFTVQNLKNELAHLNLTNLFPAIQDYAEQVYSEVVKRKKKEILRTCDLFDAIEHCQLRGLVDKFPNLQSFLHNQKGCHRVYGYRCKMCDVEKKEKENQKTLESLNISDAQSENAGFQNSTQKISTESQKVPEGVKSTLESQNQKTSKDPSPVALEASESKNSNQKTSPESSQRAKESANCEKCYRTCEMLNETKKELKTKENKLKNLEKKTSSKEREMNELMKKQMEKLEEKEKEIQGFRREIEEKVEENVNLKNQVSTLESSISESRVENLRKEETFEEIQKHQEDKISHLQSELNEEKKKKKTSEVEEQWKIKEKREFESEILEKNRKIEEFKESEIRWKTENEVNQRMIQQLLNKLGSSSSGSGYSTNYSNPIGNRKDSGVAMTSTPSKTQKCEICWNETTSQPTVQCQQCRRPFHKNCASNWLKSYKTCPSCDGNFRESARNH